MIKIWQSSADWSAWVNESGGEHRIVDSVLKIPFKSSVISGASPLAHWRFGQKQSLQDQHDSNHAALVDGTPIELSENGLLSINRNGCAVVNESTLSGPYSDRLVVSLWFKSNIVNYSDKIGIIVAWHHSVTDIRYAIVVDTDNYIKAIIDTTAGQTELDPVQESKKIDTKWHNAVLYLNATGGTEQQYFFLDNEHDINNIALSSIHELT